MNPYYKATTRSRANLVQGLMGDAGMWCDRDGMEKIIADYFKSLFASSFLSDLVMGEGLQEIEPRVTDVANNTLSVPFMPVEVNSALFQCPSFKFPGLDGFPILFYRKFWHGIGDNVTTTVLHFLNHRILPVPLNFRYVVLIPKVMNLNRVTRFRPICLCNIIYKFGSKTIVNRLKLVLPNMLCSI